MSPEPSDYPSTLPRSGKATYLGRSGGYTRWRLGIPLQPEWFRDGALSSTHGEERPSAKTTIAGFHGMAHTGSPSYELAAILVLAGFTLRTAEHTRQELVALLREAAEDRS